MEEWKEIKGRGWRGFWGRLGGGGEKGKGKGKAREEDEEDANEEDVRELMEEIKAWDREHWPSEIAPVVVQREEEGKAGPSRRRSTSSSSSMDAELYPEADDLPLPDLPPWPSSSAPSFADLDLDLVAEAPIPSSLLPLPQPGPEPIEPDLDCQCCFSPLDHPSLPSPPPNLPPSPASPAPILTSFAPPAFVDRSRSISLAEHHSRSLRLV